MAYTDLFNEAIDDLSATLATITGLRVVTDPPTTISLGVNVVAVT